MELTFNFRDVLFNIMLSSYTLQFEKKLFTKCIKSFYKSINPITFKIWPLSQSLLSIPFVLENNVSDIITCYLFSTNKSHINQYVWLRSKLVDTPAFNISHEFEGTLLAADWLKDIHLTFILTSYMIQRASNANAVCDCFEFASEENYR